MQNINDSANTKLSEKESFSGFKTTVSSIFNDPVFVGLLFIVLVGGIVIAILLIQRKTGQNRAEDEELSDFTGGEGIDWVEDGIDSAKNVSEEIVDRENDAENKSLEDSNRNNGEPNIDDDANGKLNLARAYVDMGDQDNARPLLNAVLEEGNPEQIQEANVLLERLD